MCGIGALAPRLQAEQPTLSKPHELAMRGSGQAARATSIGNSFEKYLLGTAYYPEWWEPAEWERDFSEMEALGLNTVRMGEFAWTIFEPAPGQFRFDWMDHALEIANRHGISAVLGTPTASVPPWLYALHPDVLGADALGPYTYGGRKGYCTNSANYLHACVRITTALAKHYGDHPGVIGWQLDNEPGIPFECYDQNCEHAFQLWLQRHYGSLDALNRVWNGAFWSNEYSDWSQIHFPKNSAEGGWQPAISLDYRRFFSDSYLNHLRRQADILRRFAKDQFISTNWPNATWSVNVFEAAAQFLDATAWDNYCSAPGLTRFQHQYISSMNDDFTRCAGPNQRFFCAEQIAYLPPNALPQGLRLQAYLNLAHGAHGHLYFEWRRPLAGGEQYRPSFIKGFNGEINPAKPVFELIGREFARIGPQLASATTHSDIALLYDFTNEWAQGFWSVGQRDDHYDNEATRYYGGFKVLQRNIDIIPLARDFTGYKLLVAPNLRLIDDATVQRITEFATHGGTVVLTYRAATQNSDCSMRRVLSPGPFAEIAGVLANSRLDLLEYSPTRGQLETSLEAELGIVFDGGDEVFRPRTIMESLTLQGAEPIAVYRGGRMAGKPAITRRQYGKGWMIYVGTDSGEPEFHEALARAVARTAGIEPLIAAPYGVEVSSREDEQATYYFLLNLTEAVHNAIPLPSPMDNLITGTRGLKQISLGPLEPVILASRKIAGGSPSATQ